jgi:tRNA pseudouridine55 synthase
MHAVVNLDKPAGLTSRKAMVLAQQALSAKRAGHAGTLDPIATGVLLVCLGEATKISSYFLDLEKEYTTTLKLGERTDTLDTEGTVVERVEDFSVTESQVEEVLKKFRGDIEQVPPMYSALKRSGTPLYKLARKGIEVERPPRKVHIAELELTGFAPPLLELRITCSKGTYIRTLADDIGASLGTGAHITGLRRLRIGHFRAEDAALPDELHPRHSAVHSIDSALRHLTEITLNSKAFSLALNGTPIMKNAPAGECLRLRDPHGETFAIGEVSGKKIRVRRLLHVKS